jgi:hypothetical protein
VADAVDAAVPTRRVCSRSQRWWTAELEQARRHRNGLRSRLRKDIMVQATTIELATANQEFRRLVQQEKVAYFARLQQSLCSQQLPLDIYKSLKRPLRAEN